MGKRTNKKFFFRDSTQVMTTTENTHIRTLKVLVGPFNIQVPV